MMFRHSIRRTAGFALLFALGCSAATAAKPRPDPFVPAGKAIDCIQTNMIRNTDVRNDKTIDFIMNGNKVYRNTLPNSCPSLGFEKRFLYKTSTSRLCSVDIVTVLYSGGPGLTPGASCGLGSFQPMTKLPK